jgi:hypothetical protein
VSGLRITYVVMPGTRCQASHEGGPFTPHVPQQVLSFDAPAEVLEDGFLFRRGQWALRTPRKGVVISHDTTGCGWNEWLE